MTLFALLVHPHQHLQFILSGSPSIIEPHRGQVEWPVPSLTFAPGPLSVEQLLTAVQWVLGAQGSPTSPLAFKGLDRGPWKSSWGYVPNLSPRRRCPSTRQPARQPANHSHLQPKVIPKYPSFFTSISQTRFLLGWELRVITPLNTQHNTSNLTSLFCSHPKSSIKIQK